MNLINYVHEVRSAYGISGDDSFEYLGITLSPAAQSIKLYQKPNEKLMRVLTDNSPYKQLLIKFRAFYHLDGVKICDISSDNRNEKFTYKLVFSLPRMLTVEEAKKYIYCFFSIVKKPILANNITAECLAFSNFVKSNGFLLQQLGVECDESGNIICIKYYINAKSSYHHKTLLSDEFYSNIISSISEKNISQKARSTFSKINSICKYDYSPIFMGVNVFEHSIDYKLYLISNASGFNNYDLLDSATSMFVENNWDTYIDNEQLTNIYNNNLFVKGIACTINNPDEIRLYFGNKPRTKF